MTHRNHNTICPKCGYPGKMICSSKRGVWFASEFWGNRKTGRKDVVFVVVCRCAFSYHIGGTTKRIAWQRFKMRQLDQVRYFKNFRRKHRVYTMDDIRHGAHWHLNDYEFERDTERWE